MPLPNAFSGPGPPPDPGGCESSPWSPVSEGHVTPVSHDNLAVDLSSSACSVRSRIPVRTLSRSETYSRNSSIFGVKSTSESSSRCSYIGTKIPISGRMSRSRISSGRASKINSSRIPVPIQSRPNTAPHHNQTFTRSSTRSKSESAVSKILQRSKIPIPLTKSKTSIANSEVVVASSIKTKNTDLGVVVVESSLKVVESNTDYAIVESSFMADESSIDDEVVESSMEAVESNIDDEVVESSMEAVESNIDDEVVESSMEAVESNIDDEVVESSMEAVESNIRDEVVESSMEAVESNIVYEVVESSIEAVESNIRDVVVESNIEIVDSNIDDEVVESSMEAVESNKDDDVVESSVEAVESNIDDEVVESSIETVESNIDDVVVESNIEIVESNIDDEVVESSFEAVESNIDDAFVEFMISDVVVESSIEAEESNIDDEVVESSMEAVESNIDDDVVESSMEAVESNIDDCVEESGMEAIELNTVEPNIVDAVVDSSMEAVELYSANLSQAIADTPRRNYDIEHDTVDIVQNDILDRLEQERMKCLFQEQILTREIELRKMLNDLDHTLEAMLAKRSEAGRLASEYSQLNKVVNDEDDVRRIAVGREKFFRLCQEEEIMESEFAFIPNQHGAYTCKEQKSESTVEDEYEDGVMSIHERVSNAIDNGLNEHEIASMIEHFVMDSEDEHSFTTKTFADTKTNHDCDLSSIQHLSKPEINDNPFNIDKYERFRDRTKHFQLFDTIEEEDEDDDYVGNDRPEKSNVSETNDDKSTILEAKVELLKSLDNDKLESDSETNVDMIDEVEKKKLHYTKISDEFDFDRLCQDAKQEQRWPAYCAERLDISNDLHRMRRELLKEYAVPKEYSEFKTINDDVDASMDEMPLQHIWNKCSDPGDENEDDIRNFLEAINCMKRYAHSEHGNVQHTIDKMISNFVIGGDNTEEENDANTMDVKMNAMVADTDEYLLGIRKLFQTEDDLFQECLHDVRKLFQNENEYFRNEDGLFQECLYDIRKLYQSENESLQDNKSMDQQLEFEINKDEVDNTSCQSGRSISSIERQVNEENEKITSPEMVKKDLEKQGSNSARSFEHDVKVIEWNNMPPVNGCLMDTLPRSKSAIFSGSVKIDVPASMSFDSLNAKIPVRPDIRELSNLNAISEVDKQDIERMTSIYRSNVCSVEIFEKSVAIVMKNDDIRDDSKSPLVDECEKVVTNGSKKLYSVQESCSFGNQSSTKVQQLLRQSTEWQQGMTELNDDVLSKLLKQLPDGHTSFGDLHYVEQSKPSLQSDFDPKDVSLDVHGQCVGKNFTDTKKDSSNLHPMVEKEIGADKEKRNESKKVLYIMHNSRKYAIPTAEQTEVQIDKEVVNAVSNEKELRDSPLHGPDIRSIFPNKDLITNRNPTRHFETQYESLRNHSNNDQRAKPHVYSGLKYHLNDLNVSKEKHVIDIEGLRINGTNLSEAKQRKRPKLPRKSQGALKLITKKDLPDISIIKNQSAAVKSTRRQILDNDMNSPMNIQRRPPARQGVRIGSYSQARYETSLNPHQVLPSIKTNSDNQSDVNRASSSTSNNNTRYSTDFLATPLPEINPRRNKY